MSKKVNAQDRVNTQGSKRFAVLECYRSWMMTLAIEVEQSGDCELADKVVAKLAEAERAIVDAVAALGKDPEVPHADETVIDGPVDGRAIYRWEFIEARKRALDVMGNNLYSGGNAAFMSGFFSLCWTSGVNIDQAAKLVDVAWVCQKHYRTRDMGKLPGYLGCGFAERVNEVGLNLPTITCAYNVREQLQKTLIANVS